LKFQVFRTATIADLPRSPPALNGASGQASVLGCRLVAAQGWGRMTDREFQAKLAELDRLLNDPDIRMDPHRVWTLLAEISAREARVPAGA
jgi:hypothetical protein